MIKCGECGYENMDGLDYCDGCGAKLNAAVNVNVPPSAGGAIITTGTTIPPAADTSSEVPPAATAESVDAKATPALAADAKPDAETPSSEVPTGDLKAPVSAPGPSAEPSAAPAAFKAKLSIVRGGRKGQEFPLEDGNNLVGRWDPETGSFPEVDLDADDPEAKISRKHALIRIEGGKITVEDIGSLNGTYVNRQPRLSPGSPLEIKSGDEVIIGKTFLKVVVEPIS
jgi:FHA domain